MLPNNFQIKHTVHDGISSAIGQYSDNDTSANSQVNYMQKQVTYLGRRRDHIKFILFQPMYNIMLTIK